MCVLVCEFILFKGTVGFPVESAGASRNLHGYFRAVVIQTPTRLHTWSEVLNFISHPATAWYFTGNLELKRSLVYNHSIQKGR